MDPPVAGEEDLEVRGLESFVDASRFSYAGDGEPGGDGLALPVASIEA